MGEPRGWLLFRKLTGPGSLKRMEVVIPRNMTDRVLEIMQASVTSGHMGDSSTIP